MIYALFKSINLDSPVVSFVQAQNGYSVLRIFSLRNNLLSYSLPECISVAPSYITVTLFFICFSIKSKGIPHAIYPTYMFKGELETIHCVRRFVNGQILPAFCCTSEY